MGVVRTKKKGGGKERKGNQKKTVEALYQVGVSRVVTVQIPIGILIKGFGDGQTEVSQTQKMKLSKREGLGVPHQKYSKKKRMEPGSRQVTRYVRLPTDLLLIT